MKTEGRPCARCGEHRGRDEFTDSYWAKRSGWCRVCVSADGKARYLRDREACLARMRAAYARDPAARRAGNREAQRRLRAADPAGYARQERHRYLNKTYGIGVDDFDRACDEQGGLCAITGRSPESGDTLVVDHCHDTGAVRGLLHREPNMGLGLFQDDPAQLLAAAAYLLLAAGDGDPKATLVALITDLPIIEGRIRHEEGPGRLHVPCAR